MLVAEKTGNNVFSNAMAYKNKGGKMLAELGIVNKNLLKGMGIHVEVYYADIHWSTLTKAVRKNQVSYVELSKSRGRQNGNCSSE